MTGVALVSEDGRFYSEAKNLNNDCADVATGSMGVTGNVVTGTETVGLVSFATSPGITTNCTFPDGSTWGTGTISGTVSQRSTLTLTGTGKTAKGTALPSNTVTLTYDSLYSEPSSLIKLTGTWTGATGLPFAISSNGVVSAQDPTSGCVVRGQISIINANYNAYSASVTYSNCSGTASVLNGLTATGLAALDDNVSPNVLYLGYSLTLTNGDILIVVADSTRPPVPAPSNLQYLAPPVFELGTAITPLTPTVTGTVISYAVTPALPTGLGLNPNTGVISGTPTTVVAQRNYTVTATNAGGSTQATLSIGVSGVPVIAYASASYTLTLGVPAPTITPSISGGALVTWSISPALPAGLTFNTTTGTISGIPTADVTASNYLITATNAYGQSTTTINLAIAGYPILNLGHAATITQIQMTTSRALSVDPSPHWVLWNLATDTMITSGNGTAAALAAQTVVAQTAAGLQLCSATDGHLVTTIPITGAFSWQLASDGSYIATETQTGLQAWSSAGQLLYSEAGTFSGASVFAAAGQIQIAKGPAGQNVIETISLSTSTSSVGPPFLGQFSSWFLDGSHFQTAIATTVYTYSNTSVQQDVTSLPSLVNLAGEGNWFWASNASNTALNVYAVGASMAPTATYTPGILFSVSPSGSTLGIFPSGTAQVTVVDLSGATPASSVYALPMPYDVAFGATTAAQWLAGNRHGVIVDGTTLATVPTFLSLGAASSIAGSNSVAAIATASGKIFVVNPQSSLSQGTINFPGERVQLSSDGTVLAALADTEYVQYATLPSSLNIYALPSGTLINSFMFGSPPGTTLVTDFNLAGSGNVIAQVYGPPYPTQQVTAVTGGPLIWSSPNDPTPVPISPDGTLIAVPTGGPPLNTGATNIYTNGTLTAAVPGLALGWLDNTRLLVNNYVNEGMAGWMYAGCTVYSSAAVALPPCNLPLLATIQPVTADTVYVPAMNTILSLTSGATTWTGSALSPGGAGAISGGYVVFPFASQVLAAPISGTN